MKILIRHEKQADYKIVESMARDAFWNLYFPGAEEHFLIHKIRSHSDFIKELSFVIELDGKIAGAIFYTHSSIISTDKTEHKTITFGPVFIDPKLHRQGLGRQMISHSIEKAKEMGHRAIIILGYPYHYEPYGFLGGKKYGISMSDGKFYKGLQVLPLYDGALNGISGHVSLSGAFYDLDPTELEDFDRQFPDKEKRVQESQKEFEIVSSALDE